MEGEHSGIEGRNAKEEDSVGRGEGECRYGE